MEDLKHLRDEYEKALDEAESKRAEYHAAIRRYSMTDASQEELTASTGLSDSRVNSLVGRPRRRRLAVGFAFLFLITIEMIGLVIHRLPPSQISGNATFLFEKGSDQRNADKLIQLLASNFVIRDAKFHEEGEQLRHRGYAVSIDQAGGRIVHQLDPMRVHVPPHVTVEFPAQDMNANVARPQDWLFRGWEVPWSPDSFESDVPGLKGMASDVQVDTMSQFRMQTGKVLMVVPPIAVAGLLILWILWRGVMTLVSGKVPSPASI